MAELARDWVIHWAHNYVREMDPREPRLLEELGPKAHERGYATRAELLEIVAWKSPRSRTYVEHNSPDKVKDITELALKAPTYLQHCVLDILAGVGIPVASAVCAVLMPDIHTVMDYRSIEALQRLRILQDSPEPSYPEYRTECLRLARALEVSLRDLDRALWKWHKAGMPKSA